MPKGPGRKRRAVYTPRPKAPPLPPPTTYDNIGMPLRCMKCDQIFNGPHKGETVKRGSPEYRAIDREVEAGISDGYCGKRSCIDAEIDDTLATMKQRHPDREADIDAAGVRMREHAYKSRREDRDRFPEGLIDDTEGGE